MKMIVNMTRKKWVIVILSIMVFIGILFLSWPAKPMPVDTQAIIDATTKKLELQYQDQLKNKDVALKDLRSQLIVSENKYRTLIARYVALQKEKENVKPPITNTETRDRFIALGFSPLPVK